MKFLAVRREDYDWNLVNFRSSRAANHRRYPHYHHQRRAPYEYDVEYKHPRAELRLRVVDDDDVPVYYRQHQRPLVSLCQISVHLETIDRANNRYAILSSPILIRLRVPRSLDDFADHRDDDEGLMNCAADVDVDRLSDADDDVSGGADYHYYYCYYYYYDVPSVVKASQHCNGASWSEACDCSLDFHRTGARLPHADGYPLPRESGPLPPRVGRTVDGTAAAAAAALENDYGGGGGGGGDDYGEGGGDTPGL